MIGIIADDFSGAAEVGGVAWRYGLSAEIVSAFSGRPDATAVVVNANTRCLPPDAAAERIAEAARFLETFAPEWVFFKIDSVLRGPIGIQLAALSPILAAKGFLVLPGNLTLKRWVANGQLLVDGVPVDKTFFAQDPTYPARSASVLELLGPDTPPAASARLDAPISDCPVLVGDAATHDDLVAWALQAIESGRMPVGAAPFLTGLLEAHGYRPPSRPPWPLARRDGSVLCVNGSASEPARAALRAAEESGVAVVRMPNDVFAASRGGMLDARPWARKVIGQLERKGCAIAAIDRPPESLPGLESRLDEVMADLVRAVLDAMPLDHLLLEGGATAFAITQALGVERLHVQREWSLGAVTSTLPEGGGPAITTKPGSYPWPEEIRRFLATCPTQLC